MKRLKKLAMIAMTLVLSVCSLFSFTACKEKTSKADEWWKDAEGLKFVFTDERCVDRKEFSYDYRDMYHTEFPLFVYEEKDALDAVLYVMPQIKVYYYGEEKNYYTNRILFKIENDWTWEEVIKMDGIGRYLLLIDFYPNRKAHKENPDSSFFRQIIYIEIVENKESGI